MRAIGIWWGRTPPYVLALALLATPVLAVQPDEMLADAGLEARGRDISRDIRCPVCQGETIDEALENIKEAIREYHLMIKKETRNKTTAEVHVAV